MKLVRSSKNTLAFELGHREKELLLQVLRLYPRIPPSAHRLSKHSALPEPEANQRLLEEALADLRTNLTTNN